MVPKILLPKGTVIRIGKHREIQAKCYGLELRLEEDLDHTRHSYIGEGLVVKNPNGWQYRHINHTIRDADELISLGEGGEMVDNESASILLKKEVEEL